MTTKTFFGIIAISFVFLVLLSGCSQPAPPASTPTPNPSTPTPQETPVATPTPAQPGETPAATATPAETPAETPTPAVELTYAVADCSIISLADIKTVCKRDAATSEPTTSVGKLCAVLFKDGGMTVKLEVTETTEAQALSGVKACQSFGTAVGETGCYVARGAAIAKGKYIVGIESGTTVTPEEWLCTEEQVHDLILLIQGR
ncbi:MAG: hypothetical protein NT067_00280 [Candidatus Diapherotrites archaeon]|nr:hypothetical protein [Candidatus Diapherotrites archaeon]